MLVSKKVTPGYIMNQIRDGVRSQKKVNNLADSLPQLHDFQLADEDLNRVMTGVSLNLNRLKHRVTPNMPVAFVEPYLVSRYKLLGKFIVPIRKLGARLFTKWYTDFFSSQQKHLNNDIWFGLNASIEIIDQQNKLIHYLAQKNEDLITRLNQQDEDMESLKMQIREMPSIDTRDRGDKK
jgi:hypothetical protein